MARPLPPTLRATEREFRFFQATWKGTSFTVFASPVLMLLALGVGLGGFIEDRPGLDGLGYLDFLAPGLLVAAAAQLAGGMGLWPVMAGHRWIGFHRAMVASPVGAAEVATGYLLWVALRALMQAIVFLAVAAALGATDSWWALAVPPIAALTAAGFTAPLMAYTARSDSDRAFDPIMRVVVTPLYLFSGSFFPSSQLPLLLQVLAGLFPLWHGIELARWAMAGVTPALDPALHMAVIAVWVGGGLALARRNFVRRLTP